ncbi:alpha/beta-hydrolase [Infundibulicybe gibba]|nr:alpha/beta-hydrolase [Infundibulicybe gibba]
MLVKLLPLLYLARISYSSVTGPSLTSTLGPVVNIGYAAFAGNTTSPAGPPTALGDLRFRAPALLNENAVTHEVMDARNWGPPCLQRPAVVGVGSEDCLTLNVWKPSNVSAGAALPVVGGGFYAGTPQGFPLYDWVAQHPTGIIGVSITYRLGMLGFLGGPLVAADGNLNAGLLDQRAGLEWVQRHISRFGGDPKTVTIVGESAGGAGVIMQAVAFGGSKPLPFKRVVAQSIGFGPTNTEALVESTFANAAGFAGCPTSGSGVMSCLRKASLGAIVSAINRTPNGLFAPVVEGPSGFLPDLPSRLISSGRFGAVDFVGGHCTGDGKTFAGGRPEQFVTDDDIRRIVFSRWPGVSNATIDKALALPFETEWDRAWTMAGEIIFTCMDWFFAEKVSAKGVGNVFSFSWNAPDTVLYNANPYLGAMHTSDLYYLFDGATFGNAGNTFHAFNTSEATLSAEAIAYWTSFVSVGNPSTQKKSSSPTWPHFVGSDARQRMVLTRGGDTITASGVEQITDVEKQRCMFWMSDEVTAETRI